MTGERDDHFGAIERDLLQSQIGNEPVAHRRRQKRGHERRVSRYDVKRAVEVVVGEHDGLQTDRRRLGTTPPRADDRARAGRPNPKPDAGGLDEMRVAVAVAVMRQPIDVDATERCALRIETVASAVTACSQRCSGSPSGLFASRSRAATLLNQPICLF